MVFDEANFPFEFCLWVFFLASFVSRISFYMSNLYSSLFFPFVSSSSSEISLASISFSYFFNLSSLSYFFLYSSSPSLYFTFILVSLSYAASLTSWSISFLSLSKANDSSSLSVFSSLHKSLIKTSSVTLQNFFLTLITGSYWNYRSTSRKNCLKKDLEKTSSLSDYSKNVRNAFLYVKLLAIANFLFIYSTITTLSQYL